MLEFIMEASLPKISETSLFTKFNQTSGISNIIVSEIKRANEKTLVKPNMIPDMLALMRLNGDGIVKKAISAYENGDIVIIFNKETSKVPSIVPYIVINKGTKPIAYIFADKFMNKINANQEYVKLMCVIESAYLAIQLQLNPNKFINQRQFILSMCQLYTYLVTTPLEQRLYMKGEHLTKARLYAMAYFMRMIDGPGMNITNIYKRIVVDKIDESVIKQIQDEVKNMQSMAFMDLIKLIININPVRYKNLETMYMTYFQTCCGIPLIFALENLSQLFLLATCARYRTADMTSYALNKLVQPLAIKIMKQINSINF